MQTFRRFLAVVFVALLLSAGQSLFSQSFFAQALFAQSQSQQKSKSREPSPLDRAVRLADDCLTLAARSPDEGKGHLVQVAAEANIDGQAYTFQARFVRGDGNRFSLALDLEGVGRIRMGQYVDPANGSAFPWLQTNGGAIFVGDAIPMGTPETDPLRFVGTEVRQILGFVPFASAMLPVYAGSLGKISYADDVLRLQRGENREIAVFLEQREPGAAPVTAASVKTVPVKIEARYDEHRADIRIDAWEINSVVRDEDFRPPAVAKENAENAATPEKPADSVNEVRSADLHRMFSALLNFAYDSSPLGPVPSTIPLDRPLTVEQRDTDGMLCTGFGKRILFVEGTPEQMGAAHARLLPAQVHKLMERVLYVVGFADTLRSDRWFFDQMEEIVQATMPHIPPRFLAECNALSKTLEIPDWMGIYANLFPERFHCTGVAVRGKATIDGRVYHARVLDYMRDILLQNEATVQIFLPAPDETNGKPLNRWISQGYAGFVGTVTAMNEKGLAMGEIGGRGEGAWAGLPMSLLMREIMEKAATVDEALALMRNTARTCEYYYVLSDASRNMVAIHSTPEELLVLQPGQQHELLPQAPEDTVFISSPERAEHLAERIRANYGRIDATVMQELIRRPVAMRSNLHNAIFIPESLEIRVADAGKSTVACDEPYSRFNLAELLEFYKTQKQNSSESR